MLTAKIIILDDYRHEKATMKYHANIDVNDNVYYPLELCKFFEKFVYVVRVDTRQLRVRNNSDNIRKIVNIKDIMVYQLWENNKQTTRWEIRFKTIEDRDDFVKRYRGE
jgi:hypothetical protein